MSKNILMNTNSTGYSKIVISIHSLDSRRTHGIQLQLSKFKYFIKDCHIRPGSSETDATISQVCPYQTGTCGAPAKNPMIAESAKRLGGNP